MTSQTKPQASSPYYRFQVFLAEPNAQDGSFEKKKTVGMAYLRDGQNVFTLRLWTFLTDRFYVLPTKQDPSRFLVLTREPNKHPNAKMKYFWNIVGNGRTDAGAGNIRLDFDLFDKPVFMSIFPDAAPVASPARASTPAHFPYVEDFDAVA
jgi:hypothetical protein